MGDSQTVFERIGSWFKKSSTNGEMTLAPGRVEREPRSTLLHPWRRRDAAIANLQSGFGTLTDLMATIRDNLEKQTRKQDELLAVLQRLPEAMETLPENSRMQSETLKAIHQQIAGQAQQQSKLGEILDRICTSERDQAKMIDAVRDRVETLHQHDAAISENLGSVGSVLQNVNRNSHTSAQVLEQMRDNINSRDGELERILHRQGNRFTTMLAVAIFLSIAALAAVAVIGYLGYEAISKVHP